MRSSWFFFCFSGVAILFYAFVYGLRQLLNLSSHTFLVFVTGVIIVIFAPTAFTSSAENNSWILSGSAAIYPMLFELVLPVVTLITAALRSYPGKKESEPP